MCCRHEADQAIFLRNSCTNQSHGPLQEANAQLGKLEGIVRGWVQLLRHTNLQKNWRNVVCDDPRVRLDELIRLVQGLV